LYSEENRFLLGNPEEKRQFGRPKCRRKMPLKEILKIKKTRAC
jgi:hypothetical protein